MSDIVERLRGLRAYRREFGHGLNFAVEGDDVDTALADAAAEITTLRDALREIEQDATVPDRVRRKARAALEQSPKTRER